MINDPFDQLDDLAIDDSIFANSRILLIGRKRLGIRFRNILSDDFGYTLFCTPLIDEAINYMLQFSFPVIILDFDDPDIDVVSLSNNLRKVQRMARIILVTPTIKMGDIESVINNGNVDAIIPLSLSERDLLKLIKEQEAKFTINTTMTSFVSNPPALSKASFLLLDPSLTFDDRIQPLNFVGILINSRTVSRFTHFFEDTIIQDELLLGSYLASINALGEELFNNKKSVKEINFGGISVIFRFYKTLQFSFLVRNLNRQNCDNAEDRINNLMEMIIPNFASDLMENYLPTDKENNLLYLLQDFDQIDEVERYVYQESLKERINQFQVNQILATYTNDHGFNEMVPQTLKDFTPDDWEYKIISPKSDEELYGELQNVNCGLVILDSKLENLFAVSQYIKDIAPSINIIIINNSELLSSSLTKGFNQDLFDYIFTSQKDEDLNELVRLSLKGLKNSRKLIEKALMKQNPGDQIVNPVVAKTRLLLDHESFHEEELPELIGIVISKSNEPIFERSWHQEDGLDELDNDLLTRLFSSLKQVGGEIFTDSESLGSIELGEMEVFVKHHQDFLYLYLFKNMQPNVSILIDKELEGVTSIFKKLINEVGPKFSLDLLKPMFERISDSTKQNITKLQKE